MRRLRWGCCEAVTRLVAALLALWLGAAAPAWAQPAAQELREARALASPQVEQPSPDDPRWRRVTLPDADAAPVVWYRVEFDRAPGSGDFTQLYLPFFYGGGTLWLNGARLAGVQSSDAHVRVRWERPLLLPLPEAMLRERANVLLVRAVSAHRPSATGLPRVSVGPQRALQPQFDRRLFWVRTVPLVTVVGGFVGGFFVLFIWLRRREEVLYGLFGLAAVLWAARTGTFVFDTLPAAWWPWWRLIYHASTGGFIVVMAAFALALAGWLRRWVVLALAAGWALGPLVYLMGGPQGDELVGRWWVLGVMVPVGLAMVAVSWIAAWRVRTPANLIIAGAVALATAAGLHDYLVAWRVAWFQALLPEWTGHRVFLLHHGANLLLVVMGALLTARFVRSLAEVEQANRTLEARVAERERQIAAGYARIALLQQEHAATEERQRIMRDLHDGLGSRLFTSLSRLERGALDRAGMAEMLKACIADMRLALEALASEEQDFRTALGNFMFRWERELRAAGVAPAWRIDVPDEVLAVSPHAALQVLRLLQEALTNVLKHAQARHVHVRLVRDGDSCIRLEVEDDGRGLPPAPAATAGRGLANMQARAQRLNARLDVASAPGRTCVTLVLPPAFA